MTRNPVLSKSKLLAYRQCPRQLWLTVHRPELREDSDSAQRSFDMGNEVGELARRLYDPEGVGELIERDPADIAAPIARTAELMGSDRPLFEAGFSAGGARAFADILLPVREGNQRGWRMIEVKSSTSVKDYYRDDVAIQAYIARKAGVPLCAIALAHIDNQWVYPGNGDYRGILREEDLSGEAFARDDEVAGWIDEAQAIVGMREEPEIPVGAQCHSYYECGFLAHCRSQEPCAEHPIEWLPAIRANAAKAHIEVHAVRDMRDMPDDLLNTSQLRVKNCTLSNTVHHNIRAAAEELSGYTLPACFLDFETAQRAVPIWKGIRPYEQITFQFSLHKLLRSGRLEHCKHLDLTGNDPSGLLAEALISACEGHGPIFVYNAGFERGRIGELAKRFPRHRRALLALNDRIVDLLPITKRHYYHPSQQGSWSLKAVLPAIAPDLCYENLDGVQDGGMAMAAYEEAIWKETSAARKEQIRVQLLDYCKLDTLAMVRLWQFLSGHNHPIP